MCASATSLAETPPSMLCTSMYSGIDPSWSTARRCYRQKSAPKRRLFPPQSRRDARTTRGPFLSTLERGWRHGVAPCRCTSETEVARDHEALHLVRPLADLEHLLVAIETGDRVLVREAV